MKVVAGVVGGLVGVLIVVVIAMTVIPRLRGHAGVPGPTAEAATGTNTSSGPPKPDQPLNAPKTREEQLRQDLAQKRVPFFKYLRQNFSDQIDHFSVLDDYDTLDLVVNKSDDQTISTLLQNAIGPSAREYGFRRVRWYTKNAVGSIEPYTIVAESSYDEGGRWNTFRK